MIPKSLIIPLQGVDGEGSALEYAFYLAKTYGVRVNAWHIIPGATELAATCGAVWAPGPYYPFTEIDQMARTLKTRAIEVENNFLIAAKNANVEHASFHVAEGCGDQTVVEQARLVDLIVVPQGLQSGASPFLVNALIFGSGRPILLVPQGEGVRPSMSKIMIAWDGSREAARSVAAALIYMPTKEVCILTCAERFHGVPITAEELTVYLGYHGIHAKVLTHPEDGEPVAESILTAARNSGADMIVMGAWGHTRIQEYVLGGVTHFMLNNADIPVFMAH